MKPIKSTSLVCLQCLASAGLGLLTAVTARADYKATVLADQPLAYYDLDPTFDTFDTAPDLTGHGNDAVAYNLYNVPGPSAFIPNAAAFDGQGDTYAEIGTPAMLNFTGPVTLEAWVQPSTQGGIGEIVAKGFDSAYNKEMGLRVNGMNNGANFNGSDGSVGLNGGTQTTNWSHVVFSCDGVNASLYVNGALAAQSADTSGSVAFADIWRIGDGSGDWGGNRFLAGNVCQVAIYNKGLTAQQVQTHYYMGKYGSLTPPPTVTADPLPCNTFAGGNARFTVSADSTLPMVYQWYKGTTVLTGRTNATLVLSNVATGDSGNYSVKVGNTTGTNQSAVAALTVSTPSGYAALVSGDKPIAYYPLNESSGTTAFDYAGGFNGTYMNNPTLAASGPSTYIPASATFGGSFVSLGNPAELQFTNAITMEAWVYPTTTGSLNDIMAKGFSWQPYGELCMRANGNNYTAGPATGGQESAAWTHVVGTYDGTNWVLYVNGASVSTATESGDLLYSAPWAIGSGTLDGANRYFYGSIAQAAIYTRALSATQVAAHYHMGMLGTTNPPPTITSDLTPHTMYVGANLHMSVSVDSVLPVSYKWFKGGSQLTQQTNSSLVISNIQSGDADNYSVTVSSQAGSVPSSTVAVTVLTPTGYDAVVVADKPLAYYPLNETSGSNALDYTGGFNGTYKNQPSLGAAGPTSYIAGSASFNRSYVDIANHPELNFSGPITMEAWVLPGALGASLNDIIAKGFSWSPYYEIVLRANGSTYSGGCVDASVDGAPETASWTHLVSTCDGTNWSIYANGALVAQALGRGVAYYNAPWAIANGSLDGNGRYFIGNIAAVAIYNYGLSANQVLAHYRMGSGGTVSYAPAITADPVSHTAYAGATTRFSVAASSSMPLSFQWYKGATLLANQTNASLVLAGVQTGDAGSYSVKVSNQNSTVTSQTATLTVQTPGAYAAKVIADNPIAYYPLDETSGTTAIDYASGFNASYMNSPTLGAAGPSAYIPASVSFNQSYAEIGLHPELNFSGAITMEAWVNPVSGASGPQDILGKGYNNSNPYDEVVLRGNGGDYSGGCVTGGGAEGGIEAPGWTHLISTCDGTNWWLYANGVQVGQGSGSGPDVFAASWEIANGSLNGAGRYFNGNMAQVALYNHALTATQAQNHYFQGKYGTVPTSRPGVASVKFQSGNLVFTGTNGVANAAVVLLSSTNVATPLAQWQAIGTNAFDAHGAFSITTGVNPAEPKRFYLIRQQ